MSGREVTLKVAGQTNVEALAAAIKTQFEVYDKVVLSAIGVQSTAQAAKGIARARGLVASTGRDLVCRIGFDVKKIDPSEATGGKDELTRVVFVLTCE